MGEFQNMKVGDRFKAGRLMPSLPGTDVELEVSQTTPAMGMAKCEVFCFDTWCGTATVNFDGEVLKWEMG